MPSPLPCAPAAPSPPSQRGDSWGPFLLRNINGFPLPPGAGNRHQLAPPTQTAGCQPACRPRTTWEEAPPQAARAFRRRPLGSQSKLVNLARPPHPAVGRVRPPRHGLGCDWARGDGPLTKAALWETLLGAAPVSSSRFTPHWGVGKDNERDRNHHPLHSRRPLDAQGLEPSWEMPSDPGGAYRGPLRGPFCPRSSRSCAVHAEQPPCL